MKKLFSIFALLAFAFSLSAMQMQKKQDTTDTTYVVQHEERLQKVENHLQMQANYYDHLPSYAANMYVNVDILIWAAENRGWPYCFAPTEPNADGPFVQILNRSFDWDPGFRFGLGWKTSYDWDLFVNYTRFHTTVKDSTRNDTGLMGAFTSVQFLRCISQFKLGYDMIDAEIGRPFHVGATLAFKPFIGVRGGWIKQKGINKYLDAAGPPQPDRGSPPASATWNEKDWVVGPRTGISIDYLFGQSGFGFYGNLAAALLYGECEVTLKGYDTRNGVNNLAVDLPIPNHSLLKANLETGFGLSWGDFIDKENLALRIRLGWEASMWFDMSKIFILYGGGGDGGEVFGYEPNHPLIMQGGVINARLDF